MSASIDRLIAMANQIARELGGQQGARAAAATADHLRAFWDPAMRRAILAHAAAGGDGLSPLAREAVTMLGRHEGPAGTTRATRFDEGQSDAG